MTCKKCGFQLTHWATCLWALGFFFPFKIGRRFGELNYLLLLPGIEPRFLSCPVRILITTSKTISGSFCVILSTELIDICVFYMVGLYIYRDGCNSGNFLLKYITNFINPKFLTAVTTHTHTHTQTHTQANTHTHIQTHTYTHTHTHTHSMKILVLL
jgi:hypothetical protein